jgi:hypothetical protein
LVGDTLRQELPPAIGALNATVTGDQLAPGLGHLDHDLHALIGDNPSVVHLGGEWAVQGTDEDLGTALIDRGADFA